MQYLITGGTGFIGGLLCGQLARDGHTVCVLTRSIARARQLLPAQVLCVASLEDAPAPDAVINLAGAPIIGGRWTPARKRLLVESRAGTTGRLVDWMAGLPRRPQVLISASAIGYYGPQGDASLDEQAPAGTDFAAQLCQTWEAQAQRAESLGMRVCRVRIGLVLGLHGGTLAAMLPAFRQGLGGPLGDGRQWMSWVHLQDLIALLRWLVENPSASGAYNGTAPQPVTNAEFTQTLGRALHRPAVLRAPAFALRAALGELSGLLLNGQRVLPARAQAQGFAFAHPELAQALSDILRTG